MFFKVHFTSNRFLLLVKSIFFEVHFTSNQFLLLVKSM